MKRVSLGIILDGNPNYIQKRTLFLKIVEFLCLYTWIAAGIIGAIIFVIGLFQDSTKKFYIGLGLILCTVMLWAISYMWDEKVRCSYCGHFLTLKRISENQFVDSTEKTISQKVYDNHSGMVYNLSGDSAFYTGTSSHREYGKEIEKRYVYNLRCSCCGSVCKVEKREITKQFS